MSSTTATKDSEGLLSYMTTWYSILAALIVAYRVTNYIGSRITSRRLGCKPIYINRRDGFFGFKAVYEIWNLQKKGTVIDHAHGEFEENEGPSDTTRTRLAGKSLIFTRDPDNVKAMLSTQFQNFTLGSRHAQLRPLLGDSVFTLEAEGWKHSRAMLRPQFVREQIGHVKMLEPHVQLFFKHVRNHNGKPFDMQSLLFRLTIDSASEFLFGECVDSLKDDSVGVKKSLKNADGKEGFYNSLDTVQTYMWIRSILQDFHFIANTSQLKSCANKVHNFADFYVQKALNMGAEDLIKHSSNSYVILYELVKETRNPKVLRDQLLSILLAGRDPTAISLSFALYELARNRNVWERLREEITSAFGSGEDANVEQITFESLKRCEYLKAVINETLRLYPPVPQNLRRANKTTSLPKGGGEFGEDPILVEKGQAVVYLVYSMHRNVKYYGDDAEIFRPERWFEPRCRKLGWSYLPFNGGPRVCLGQQFALTEASYVLTRIVQSFSHIESHDKDYPPSKNTHLVMMLKDGCNISLY